MEGKDILLILTKILCCKDCLFGSRSSDYAVTLHITKIGLDHLSQASISKTGKFLSKLLQCQSGNYYGFEVLLDSPGAIKKNIKYL